MSGRNRQNHRTLRRPLSATSPAEDPRFYLGETTCDGPPAAPPSTSSSPGSTCTAGSLTPAPLPELLTFPEVRELLRISRNTLYRLSNAGKIPGAYKVGNSWRYPRVALEGWIRGSASGPVRARKTERWG